MNKVTFLFLIVGLLFSCKNQTDSKTIVADNKDSIKVKKTEAIVKPSEKLDLLTLLNKSVISNPDTTFLFDSIYEYGKVKFSQISKEGYLDLLSFMKSSQIPIQKPSGNIEYKDSCHIIRLGNGLNDTLCDFSKGEYYEKYTILSDWTEKNQLLIQYDNWEESLKYLYNKTDGSIYNLGVSYKFSQNFNWLLYYIDFIQEPLYSNCFGIAHLDSLSIKPLFDLRDYNYTVRSGAWLNDSLSILSVSTFDYDIEGIYDQDYYYLMKVTK